MPAIVRNKKRITRRKTFKKMLRPRNLYRTKRSLSKFYKDPFPKVMYTTLRFTSYVTLSSSDTDAVQTYRLNSVYDPDFTGVGSQARLVDTLLGADGGNAPYGSYRVLSANYKADFYNSNSNGFSTGPVGVHVRNSTSTAISPVTWEQLGEVPNTRAKWAGSSGSDVSHQIFKGHVRMRDFFALNNTKDDANAAAAYNANPSDQVYLDCMYRTVNASGGTYPVYLAVTIYYHVQLFDRNLTIIS